LGGAQVSLGSSKGAEVLKVGPLSKRFSQSLSRRICFNGIWVLALIAFLARVSSPVSAQRVIVEIDKIQVVRAISGVIRDPGGGPIPGVTVAELSADGMTVIQSTTTDQGGTFSIVPITKKKVYHLRISFDKSPDFNPLIVHVRISRWTKKLLDLKLEIAT
jgi:carboxypeptidase family protein